MATLQRVLEKTYNSLGQASDSTNYGYALVLDKVNDVVNKICKGRVVSIINQQVYTAGDLPFLRNDKLIQLVKPIFTQELMEEGYSTIKKVDTSKYNTSGKLFVGGDIITYTGKTLEDFTGVTDISIYHNSGEKIYQLYALPNGISLPFSLFVLDKNGQRSEELKYCDYRQGASYTIYYTIVTHGGSNYLHVYGMNDERLLMIYYINSTKMVNSTDVCIIPDDFVYQVVPDIVAGELLRENEETEDAQGKLIKGYSALSEMYAFYSSMIKKNKETIKLAGMNFSSIMGGYGKGQCTSTRQIV